MDAHLSSIDLSWVPSSDEVRIREEKEAEYKSSQEFLDKETTAVLAEDISRKFNSGGIPSGGCVLYEDVDRSWVTDAVVAQLNTALPAEKWFVGFETDQGGSTFNFVIRPIMGN